VTIYFGLNLAYLVGLNDISIVDVLVIAVGFVIRLGAGAVLVEVNPRRHSVERATSNHSGHTVLHYDVHRTYTALAGRPPLTRLIMNYLRDHDSEQGPLHDRDDAGVGSCSSATPVGVLTTAYHNPYNQPYVRRGAANREQGDRGDIAL
jgi:hypothetical protein